MLSTARMSLKLRYAAMILALGFAAACDDDDPVEPDPEPETATIRLQIGTQTINMATSNGAITGGPVVITRATATPLSATFLRADGTPDPVVQASTFELRIATVSGGVTFSRTGAFAGTLTGPTAGAASVSVLLYHLSEQHEEYGPFTMPITVQ